MWLKALIAGLIIAFCTFLGYLAAGKYRARRSFFSQLAVFNERYLSELSYRRRPIGEFLAAYRYTGEFGKTVASLGSGKSEEPKSSIFTAEERKFCSDYLDMIGKGDAHSQSGFCTAQKPMIEAKKAESEKEAKTRGELYLKLGLIAGLAFVILIV